VIRRIRIRSQPGQIVQEIPSQKRAGRVAQGVGPEFKPQHHTEKKKKKGTRDFKNTHNYGAKGKKN
jgi:hypothetical protein